MLDKAPMIEADFLHNRLPVVKADKAPDLSNRERFFSVRVAALQSLVRHGVRKISIDGLTAQEQLDAISRSVRDVLDRQQTVWRDLVDELAKERIEILSLDELKKREMDKIEEMFMEQIYPVLTPIAIDPAHPFPFIPNGEFALALELERGADGRLLEALLPVPHQLPRFIRLDDTAKGKVRFLAEDLVREFETALKRRRRGMVIRLEFSSGAGTGIRDKIFEELEAESSVLHHPYETFDTVVQFLTQAARDPNVLAIKQTLYRTSNQSSIVSALCEASEGGKSVTALVELKARFDEAANIRQSRRLERAGAQVIYGFVDWKTHAKISTVVRREGDRLRTYTHFGTGNYHPITANFYTDLSLFTCDPALGRDATNRA